MAGGVLGLFGLEVLDPQGDSDAGLANIGIGIYYFFTALALGGGGGAAIGCLVALRLRRHRFAWQTAALMLLLILLGFSLFGAPIRSPEIVAGLLVYPSPVVARFLAWEVGRRKRSVLLIVIGIGIFLLGTVHWFYIVRGGGRAERAQRQALLDLTVPVYVPSYVPDGYRQTGLWLDRPEDFPDTHLEIRYDNRNQDRFFIYQVSANGALPDRERQETPASRQEPITAEVQCGRDTPNLSLEVPCVQVDTLPSGDPLYREIPGAQYQRQGWTGRLYVLKGDVWTAISASASLGESELVQILGSLRKTSPDHLEPRYCPPALDSNC